MKKHYLYAIAVALTMGACADHEVVTDAATPDTPSVVIPSDAEKGELLIKFAPEVGELLDRTMTRAIGGVSTRSGIPSTDEVLDILGAYHFERVFPVDSRTEDKARKAGIHLWYQVKFDEGTDLAEAYSRLSKLGEVSKIQTNRHIRRAYDATRRPQLLTETTQKAITRATATFDDPMLDCQWGLINDGSGKMIPEGNTWAQAIAGSDVNAEEAWKLCTGNPEIIVAVLDEGVMYDHPDLAPNMWRNEGETFNDTKDNDGNGYRGDYYGYNFVKMTPNISYSSNNDTGHGTHVAGIIAAANNNGIGVSSIAGGDGTPNSGVRIMSCQVFDGENGVTIANEAKAMKYAADNGAVILQCSWGYNSSEANPLFYEVGPATEAEWEEAYPLEKDAIDYFIQNAGSPNGVINGGLIIFAAGNESAGAAGFPGAYSKCISVGAVAADFTPSTFSNFGSAVDLSAPGGDSDYYGIPGYTETTEDRYQGGILSTLVERGVAGYAYMDGTSMACPTVSGVAALGLSYAAQQRRHFTAEEYTALLKSTGRDLDGHFADRVEKLYHYNHTSAGTATTLQDLLAYRGNMGVLVDAGALLKAIGGGAGSDMKIPNIYIAPEQIYKLDLARFFVDGETMAFSLSGIADANIASVTVEGTVLTVTGLKSGSTQATIKAGSNEQTIIITVRRSAGDNGWM